MTKNITEIQDTIISEAISQLSEQGWSWHMIETATKQAGFQDGMEYAVFPNGLTDSVSHFTDMIDRKMMARLETVPLESLRVRDKIRLAMMTRFQLLDQLNARHAVKASLAYWALPTRVMMGQQILWRTADRIWTWAGDTSTDYNRYTKRGLLNSILMGTSLVFVDDTSPDLAVTRAFLDRRIDNIMEIGKVMGGAKTIASGLWDKYRSTK
jgi:ubiquinone biosynthesis protein COQ9